MKARNRSIGALVVLTLSPPVFAEVLNSYLPVVVTEDFQTVVKRMQANKASL